jgi:hypothetical protein
MKLFGERVEHTFTNSPHNILQVKDYNEIFFDVYEIELNNGKYPVEKISEESGMPVVSIPIIVEGVEREVSFVLARGDKNFIFLNSENKNLLKSDEPLVKSDESVEINLEIPQILHEDVDEHSQESYFQESKKEILDQIEDAKKQAIRQASRIKKKKLEEADADISKKKKALDVMLESARGSLVEEFLNISEKIKKEFISENDNRWEEVKETIDNKIGDMSLSLSQSLKTDFSTSEKQFDEKIRELIKELYKSLQPKIDNDLKDIANEIVEKVDSIENELIERVEKIDRGVNKSLSRVGNLDKKVDSAIYTISEEIDDKLRQAELKIEESCNDKLKVLESKNLNINDNNRKYLIDLITESKHGLIEEVRKIAGQNPIEYVVESGNIKKTINEDDIVKNLEKKVNFLVSDVETRLRKYVSVYGGGGGTVATQYQDGGIMNGDLMVYGNITASGVVTGSNLSGYNTGDQDLSGLVPYIGATDDVDLGSRSLSGGDMFSNNERVLTVIDEIPADQIIYDNFKISNGAGLESTNVQDALDELEIKKLNVKDAGTNLILFATTAASDLSGYNALVCCTSRPQYDTVAVDVSAGPVGDTNTLVGQLVSRPGVLIGDPGIINITTIGNIRKVSGNRNAVFFFEVYRRDSDGNEFFLTSSDPTPEVSSADYRQFSEFALLPLGITFSETDRVIIRYYGRKTESGGNDPIYQFQFGGIDPVRTLFPVSAGITILETWRKKDNNVYYNLGNVGIGTDTPTEALDVVGNVVVSENINSLTHTVSSLSAFRIFTTHLDALSANITVLDIKQYELSGFNVQGDCTIQGSVSASGNISGSNLVYNTDGSVKNIISLTQAAYNDLSPNYDSQTLYIII